MMMNLLRFLFLSGLVAAVLGLGYLGWLVREHD
jgi:hypothetical protein